MRHSALVICLRAAAIGAALSPALLGCGARPEAEAGYANSARHRYELGMEALLDEDFLEAIKQFTFVKNKFAYSKYAALAEIRMADAYFAQEKFVEAIDAYRTFVQGHPNHEDVPTALWRIGVCHYEQVPSDFMLFPPAHEKDQAATKDALRALERYVERFPKHTHAGDARKKITACRGDLADHELYVAKFYIRLEKPLSARGRLEGVVRDYSDVPDRWGAAALLLLDVYLDIATAEPDEAAVLRDKALTLARLVVERQPRSGAAEEARAFLKAVGKG